MYLESDESVFSHQAATVFLLNSFLLYIKRPTQVTLTIPPAKYEQPMFISIKLLPEKINIEIKPTPEL